MDYPTRIEELIQPSIEGMGYELVRVLLNGKEQVKLQIMAERADRKGMTVEDCANISRAVSAVLDVEDPIEAAYTLEVSSPGMDRPLTRSKDYDRFSGFEARIEMDAAVDGRRRFKGRLGGFNDGNVLIDVDGTAFSLPLQDIRRAKLLMTDELVAAFEENQEL